jgi:hypothetical protein
MKIYTLVFAFFVSIPLRAENPSEMFERLRNAVEKNYQGFLLKTYDNLLDQELSRQLGDWHYSMKIFELSVAQTKFELHQVGEKLKDLLQNNSSNKEKEILDSTWLGYKAKRLKEESLSYQEYLNDYKNLWNTRCTDERSKVYTDIYNPLTAFPRGDFAKVIEAGYPPIQIAIPIATPAGSAGT